MDVYLPRTLEEALEVKAAHPEALPASHSQKAKQEPLPRVVCDYIAGMTDNFILSQHARLVTRDMQQTSD